MNLAIGADHAGYEHKAYIIKALEAEGHSIQNFGTDTADSVDYPDHVHPVAEAVENGAVDQGILICGSANGVAMTANKHQGVRAAICWDEEITKLARQHNDANVICLPARFVSREEALRNVQLFLITEFEGDRHARRVSKIPC